MNKSLLSKITNYLNDQKIKSRRNKIFMFLSIIVIVLTLSTLMKPAITMGEVLICDKEEHTHTEECYEQKFICDTETEENLNNESCFESVLITEHEEHTHTSDCYVTEDEYESINELISIINSIPTYEEMNNHIEELSNNGSSTEEIDEYRDMIIAIASNAYYTYQDMYTNVQNEITNIDKLMEYKNNNLIEEKSNLAINLMQTDATYAIARNTNSLTIVDTASTKEFIELNLYDYGSNINTKYKSNNKFPGFQWNGGAHLKGSYNRNNVDQIDFGNSMITDFKFGTATTNNAKSTYADENTNIGNKGGAINALDTSYGVTNKPIGMSTGTEVLSRTLDSNGYPALADGTSLSYLFKNGTYAVKQNTTSIDGLFKQNTTTGAYSYNSRENHAQYSNNEFTVYDQILTPNFIVYPFGNFLPLNDITSSNTATQVGGISSFGTYIQTIIDDLKDDADYGNSTDNTKKQLVEMLTKYKNNVGNNTINSWEAVDAIEDYFKANDNNKPNNPNYDQSVFTETLLNKMYNIDYNVETNFFFGMEMKMNFMQPKSGLTGNDTNKDGTPDYPMEFYFTGDDDVWVYIDDVLFLDLSGIHRHVGGKIDFVNGKVYYYQLDVAGTGDVSTTPYKTYTFEQLLTEAGKSTDNLNNNGTFKDYTTHSFKFYYMERGSGSSVCRLNFNFPLLRQNSISISKELSADVENIEFLGNPDFKFQVLKANTNGNKTQELFIGANTEYTIYDESDDVVATSKTDSNGIITIKAGQRAEFTNIKENTGKYYVRELLESQNELEQYGKVTISGESSTNSGTVQIGNDTFNGLDSPVKDMSDGSTIFKFNNEIDTYKYGSLKIEKIIDSYQNSFINKNFIFNVTLDGTSLPVGTTYTVTKEDGTTETKTIETAGKITIQGGEIAQIDKILAGSKYKIVEELASNSGYTIIYNGNNELKSVEGEITLNTKENDIEIPSASITVTNKESGDKLPISITKDISNPNNDEYEFNFKLVEVTDESGNIEEIINNSFQTNILNSTINTNIQRNTEKTANIKLTDTGTYTFELSYTQSEYSVGITTKYYKIVEISGTDEFIKYDNTKYVIEVTITNDLDDNNEEIFKTEITKIWKDGELYWKKTNETLTPTIETIKFINTLLSNLTISKTVEHEDSTDGEFQFKITLLNKDDTPLNETFKYYKKTTGSNSNQENNITFGTDGTALITLKHNEEITIENIPTGTNYIIEELTTDGYVVKYKINDEINIGATTNKIALIKGENNSVEFINSSGFILPATGSSGMLIMIIIGSLLLIVPVIYIGYIIYNRERKVS